jgi:hypothetical protein
LHTPALRAVSELGMASADGDIVEKNITLLGASDIDYLTTGIETIFRALTWPPMHNQHGRPTG